MSFDPPLSAAERAYQRILERYSQDRDRQRELVTTMSILGITPNDKVWIAVVVALDFIDALRLEGSAAVQAMSVALTEASNKIDDASSTLGTVASTMNVSIVQLRTEAGNAAAAVREAAAAAGSTTAKAIGSEILASHGDALRATVAQRDDAIDILRGYKVKTVALGLLCALLVGTVLGWWIGVSTSRNVATIQGRHR